MLWKLNEAKNFHGNFHDMLERVVGVEIKCHITFFREQIRLQVLVFDLGISTSKERVSTLLGKSGKVREFVRESGNVREISDFLDKVGKVKEEFLSMQIFNFKKNYKKCT